MDAGLISHVKGEHRLQNEDLFYDFAASVSTYVPDPASVAGFYVASTVKFAFLDMFEEEVRVYNETPAARFWSSDALVHHGDRFLNPTFFHPV